MSFQILKKIVNQEIKKRFQKQDIKHYIGEMNIISHSLKSLQPLFPKNNPQKLLQDPPIIKESNDLILKQTPYDKEFSKKTEKKSKKTRTYTMNLDAFNLFNKDFENQFVKKEKELIQLKESKAFSKFMNYFNNQR